MRKALLSIPKKFGLLTFIIVCILTACSKKDEKAHCIMPAGTTLEEGDIVLRKGTGLTSRAVRIADGGSDFSHCGIIVDSCDRKMVVHAVPDEPDFEGDVDRVKMERPEDFFSTIRASKGCVLRYQDKETAEKSASLADKQRKKRRMRFEYHLYRASVIIFSAMPSIRHQRGLPHP